MRLRPGCPRHISGSWCRHRQILKLPLNGRRSGFLVRIELAARRASKKLRNDDSIVPILAGSSLKDYLDRIPLWRGNHVSIPHLAEDFARYLYLPRLTDTAVLLGAIREGVGLLTWVNDSFAYADSFDEASSRYRGLRGGQNINISEGNLNGLLVKPDVAYAQIEAAAVSIPGKPVTNGGGRFSKLFQSTEAVAQQ